MSDYFQRLIQQSGLRLREPIAPPAPASGLAAATPAGVGSPANFGLREIYEERVAAPLPPPESGAPTPPLVSTASQVFATPSSPAPATVSSATNFPNPPGAIVSQSQIEVTPVAPPSAAPAAPEVVNMPVHPVATGPADRENQPRPNPNVPRDGVPAEIMQAVMQWISAAQHEPAPKAKGNADQAAPSLAQAINSIAPAESSNPPSVPTPAIPERIVEIVTEHFEPAPAPPAPVARSAPAQPGMTAAPASPPAAEPVHVSIGSINLRIEAPPVAAAPAGLPRAEPGRSSLSPRASNFSKLRRHYILPH